MPSSNTRRGKSRRSNAKGSSVLAVLKSAFERNGKSIVLKILICAFLIGVSLLGAFWVGDADYNASAVGWIPFIAIVTAIALAFVYILIAKNALEIVDTSIGGSCMRGETVTISTRFKNKYPVFLPRMKVNLFISDSDGKPLSSQETTLALAPFETYQMKYGVKFDHIGTFTAGVYSVEVTDFLTLFTHLIKCRNNIEVNVTPKTVGVKRLTFSNEASLEAMTSNRSTLADSLDYAQVREYVPGDPLKTIHWKLSARGEQYLTRLYEINNNPGCAVIMDFFSQEKDVATRMGLFDAVVESGFSLATYSKSMGLDTEMFYANRFGERSRKLTWTNEAASDIVGDLPKMSNNPVQGAETIDLIHSLIYSQNCQNNLIVCTANVSADMVSLLLEARARKRNPIMIACVPGDLIGREREDYCAALGRLSQANIGFIILADSAELGEVSA